MRALIVATVMLAVAGSAADDARARPIERPLAVAGSPARLARVLDDRAIAGWHARWDHDTGVVAEMSGTFVPAPGAMLDAAVAERAARAFIAAHLDVIAPGACFVVVANQLDDGVRSVGFQQMYRGLRVVGAQVGVV